MPRGDDRASCPDERRQGSSFVPTGKNKLWLGASFRSCFCHPVESWDAASGSHYKDRRYFAILEQTMSGQFQKYYLVLEDENGVTRAVQPLFIASHDLAGELPAWLKPLIDLGRKVRGSFLRPRMLMAGSSVGDGWLGGMDWPCFPYALHAALKAYALLLKTSLIPLKDLPVQYRQPLAGFGRAYTRIPSYPANRLELNFPNFDDYVARKLGRETRRDLRRKWKRSAALAQLDMEIVSDLGDSAARVHQLYLQVVGRSDIQFDVLTESYFRLLGQRLPDRVRFFLWRLEGRLVAFSLCFIHGDTLYDHDIGFDYSVALDLHLYFVTRRDLLRWAMEQGFKTCYCSPYNYEPKLRLGFELVPFDLYVRSRSSLVNWMISVFGSRFALPATDPVLKKCLDSKDGAARETA